MLFRADEYGTFTVTVIVSKNKAFETSASIAVVVKEQEEIPYLETETDSEE